MKSAFCGFYSRKNTSSNFFSSAMQMISASFAVGQNCPVSMELIVFLETPTICASSDWEIFFSVRNSFSLFLRINESSTIILL